MKDELELLTRQNAYLDTLRGLYRRERLAGLVVILAGAGLLTASRFVTAMPHMLIWTGYATLAFGWTIYVYAVWRRTAWRRANPFNPSA